MIHDLEKNRPVFKETPKPFTGCRDHKLEVLVGGLDNEIYEVEKGHHSNWARKYLNLPEELFQELLVKSLKDEKNLPEPFFNVFPTFVRILVTSRTEPLFSSGDGCPEAETSAYFETKNDSPQLRSSIRRVLRIFKNVKNIQIHLHDSKRLVDYSLAEYLKLKEIK
jgi:hypothetical protein